MDLSFFLVETAPWSATLFSSVNIWKELDANEICCMEWAQATHKLQVRETFSCTIVTTRESAAEFFLAPERMKVGQGFLKHAILVWISGGWSL